MRKKLISVLLVLAITLSQSFLFVSAVNAIGNPFAQQDKARLEAVLSAALPAQLSGQMTVQAVAAEKIASEKTDTYTVQFRSSVPLKYIYQCVSHYTYELLADSEQRLFKIYLSDAEAFKAAYYDILEYVEITKERTLSAVPNDPYYDDQWAIPDINLPEAWDITKGVSSVKIAVIDSGIYRGHEDLSNSTVSAGYDVTLKKDGVTSDEEGHGTMVTSVIAAGTDNEIGMAGGCWNITIVPYKVVDAYGNIDSADVVTAIIMAADAGCDVINISLGGYGYDKTEQTAVNYAVSKSCIIVAAAGNEGTEGNLYSGQHSYPASDAGVISVAAIDSDNVRSTFSQYNDGVDVCAPGEDIIVAGSDEYNTYYIADGTSFSSPYVAAVAALVRSVEPTISADYFEQLIKQTSTDLGTVSKDNYYGWGLINAESMVDAATQPIVSGVQNNQMYYDDVTITFTKGTALLNGQPFISGTVVSDSGEYTLIVTDDQSKITTVHFVIDKMILEIFGVQDGGIYKQDVTITYHAASAELNGVALQSGTTVSRDGSYTLIVSTAYGRTETCSFLIDKTAPVVIGVQDNETYNTPVNITFNDGTARLNGDVIDSNHDITANGSYTLVVTDQVGNSTNINFVVNISTANQQNLQLSAQIQDWYLDESYNILYATCWEENALLCINAATMNIDRRIDLGSIPSDMFQENGKLYICMGDAKVIKVFNLTGRTIETTISTSGHPYQAVKYNDKIIYGENTNSGFYIYDLNTGISQNVLHGSQVNLAINKDLGMLYLGQTNSTSHALWYYSMAENQLLGKIDIKTAGVLTDIVADDTSVYYAGRAFSLTYSTHAQAEYNISENIIYSKNNCIFTNISIFNRTTHEKIGRQLCWVALVHISSQGTLFVYDMSDNVVTKYISVTGQANADNVASILTRTCIPITGILFPQSSIASEEGQRVLPMSAALTEWSLDEQTNMLCAISREMKALFFINASTLNLQKTIYLDAAPQDIITEDGKAYIALDSINQIEVFDIAGQTLEKHLYTSSDPYNVVKDGNKLYYTEMDQWCYLFEYNLDTDQVSYVLAGNNNYLYFYEPDLELNATQHILYIGASGTTGSQLTYFDFTTASVIGATAASVNIQRKVVYDGTTVYYKSTAYDAADPSKILADFDSEILFAQDGSVFTNHGRYDATTFEKVEDFPTAVTLFEISARADLYAYDPFNQTITQYIGEEDLPPEVTGVEDGGGYVDAVTITFNEGTALLDGAPFVSGATVTALGEHTLVVADNGEHTVTIAFTLYAAQADDGDAVSIPDANLLQALIAAGADKDKNGTLTKGEMRMQPKYLDVSGCEIKNLTGLEYAYNLRGLDLSYNTITDLSPVSGLAALEVLYADGNGITNLQPLAALTALRELSLCNNTISDIGPLATLVNLTTLDLSGNGIVNLQPLASLTKLGQEEGYLALEGNRISNIAPLAGLTDLTALYLTDNQITDIRSLDSLPGLLSLSIAGNPVSDFSTLRNLVQLQYLDISDMGMVSLQAVSGLTNLQFLFADDNDIRDITPLQNLTQLMVLNLSDNCIDFIDPLQNLTMLINLNLYNNEVGDLTPIVNLNLSGLDVSENYLDLTAGSADMNIINAILDANPDILIVYEPQKSINSDIAPVITIAPYSTAPTNGNVTVTASANKGKMNASSHTFTDNGSFTFTATDSAGKITRKTVTVTNIDKIVPAAPAGVRAASAGYNAVCISWNAVSGASGYRIYRAASAGGSYVYVGETASASFTDSGLTTNVTYYYKVSAYRTVGAGRNTGNYSSVASAKPIPAAPASLKAVSASYNSIRLTWNAVSGASGFNIYRATSATGTYTTIASVTAAGYTNISLSTGSTYYYKVQAYRMVNGIKVYGNCTAAVSAKPIPAAPASLKAVSASYNSIKLTWNAVSGASGYNIYRATSATGTYATIASVTAAGYTNISLSTGSTYYYKVQAYRMVNGKKVYGNCTAAVSAKPLPVAPASFTAARYSSSSIKLTWRSVSGANGYEVYRSASLNGTYSLVTTLTSVSYINTRLTRNTTYYYKVRAYRIVGGKKIYGYFTGVKSAKPY